MEGLGDSRSRSRRSRPPRHSVRSAPHHTIGRIVALSLIFALSFSGTALGLSFARFQRNISQQDIDKLLGDDRPTLPAPVTTEADPNAGRALNILVIGSDSRDGGNQSVDGSGTSPGMRSDTTMLVHIAADRSRVDLVSIPRDTLVDIPECHLADGSTTPPKYDAMFNSAFSAGGSTGDVGAAAACTMLTVEQLTGIYIDDFVVVDFAGFISVIDSLGGIAMYIPEDIDDKAANLQLDAGCRLLDGTAALGLARVRKTVGDGSDISRIGRQQDLVMAVVNEALTTSLLTNPARLYQFLDSTTRTLTTGQEVGDLTSLVRLGSSLSALRVEDLTLITMPFVWAGARVRPSEDYAAQVWDAIRADVPPDPLLSGDASDIAVAVMERERAAAEPTQAPTAPAAEPGIEATTPPAPADEALLCTKKTAT